MLRKMLNSLLGRKNNEKEQMLQLMAQMQQEIATLRAEKNQVNSEVAISSIKYDENGNIERDKDIMEANDYQRDAMWNSSKINSNEYDSMNYLELKRTKPEVIEAWIVSLRSQIIAKGYKAIPEICEQFRTELLQDFVTMQNIQLGSYAPEFLNIESMTRAQLIDTVAQLNMLQWEAKQKESGKDTRASKGQIDYIQKFEPTWNPSSKVEASMMITTIRAKYGLEESSNEVSEKQFNRLNKLVELLEVSAKDYVPTNKSQASKMIEELQKQADEVLGARPATDKQKEMYSRYLKLNNLRMTKARNSFLEKATQADISIAISELKEKYNKEHPEASEGQIGYIMTLASLINAPINREDICKLTKEDASKLIDKLSRDRLYFLGLARGASYSKTDIAKMSKDEVKRLTDDLLDKNAMVDMEERA